MRDQPLFVDRVAREAAAEMIVDAALAHAVEGGGDRLQERPLAGPDPGAPEKQEAGDVGKLRRRAEAAEERVDFADEAPCGTVDDGERRQVAGARDREFGECFFQCADVLRDRLGLALVGAMDAAQHVDEARAAIARAGGKIGAAPEGFAGGGEEHGQRPAAGLAQQRQRRLIDGVDVGPLLAVDLDVDEELVHHRGRRRVLEALMGHDVAPMAGGIADREQHRHVAALGLGEGGRAPGLPMDGVVLVL